MTTERIEERGALPTTLEQRLQVLRDADIAKGLERGLKRWRQLLARQVGRKLAGDAAVDRAGLAGIRDPDRLQDVGEWIVDCDTGAELLAQHGKIDLLGRWGGAGFLRKSSAADC